MERNELENRIDKVGNLLNFISQSNTFENLSDVRSITLNLLADNIQNFFIALKLSSNLRDINYCKSNLSEDIRVGDLDTLNFTFHGFIRDGFFNSIFIVVENHFRQLSLYCTLKEVDSIKRTFEKLIEIPIFNSILDEEKERFYFFCYLRNTMHNIGLQTKTDLHITIEDKDSVIDKSQINLSLTKNNFNSINFDSLLSLLEQVFKLILKVNNLIPKNDIIVHNLSSTYG